jgi:membrane protein YqaA with SNARE-associated domain
MTSYVLNHKAKEVISERDIKRFQKEYATEKVTTEKLYQIYLVLQILILMTFNLYSKLLYLNKVKIR